MKYIVRSALTLPAGSVLGLNKIQAADRSHVLAPVSGRKGCFTATAPVQFKVGEEIACDESLPKGLAESLEEIEKAAAEKAAAEKAAAEKAAAEKAAAEKAGQSGGE